MKSGKAGAGTRYTDEQKKEVVDFAVDYNATHGRGGQSKAAAKFKVSQITVMTWLKKAGVKLKKGRGPAVKPSKAAKPAPLPKASKAGVSRGMDSKLNLMLTLSNKIAKAEVELSSLKAQFKALKASL